jgi:hypothetical protein
VRIGLTRDQVRDNRLERLSIEVKDSDSRSARYLEQHGDRCWEVDILPGEVIEARLGEHINSWLDVDAWRRREVEIERCCNRLRRRSTEAPTIEQARRNPHVAIDMLHPSSGDEGRRGRRALERLEF